MHSLRVKTGSPSNSSALAPQDPLGCLSDCSWSPPGIIRRGLLGWNPSLHHDSCHFPPLCVVMTPQVMTRPPRLMPSPNTMVACEGVYQSWCCFCLGQRHHLMSMWSTSASPSPFSHTHSGSQHEFLSGYGGNLSVTENALHRTVLPLDLGSFSPTWTCVLRFLLRTFLGRLLRDPSSQPSKLDRIQVWTQLRLRLGPPDTFNNEESPQ